MRVKLHPDARAELRAARKWYYERSPLSAFAFAQTVQNAISRIKDAPNTFPLADHGTRQFILQGFLSISFIEPARLRSKSWRSHIRSDDQAIGPIGRYLDRPDLQIC